MEQLTRRNVLKGGGAAIAGYTVMRLSGPVAAFPGGGQNEEVIPWLDQPAPNPVPDVVGHPLVWEELDSRVTPADEVFTVKHYQQPEIDPATWELTVGGMARRPYSLDLADLRSRPRQEVEFTLECSGNTGLPFFIGGIGNAVWGGASLKPVLERARPRRGANEVVFWGADSGEVTVQGGWSAAPGSTMTFVEQFARSMSLEDAMAPDNMLCYEMNGAPLTGEHGAPVRLIAPGWYGVANVKWLVAIEFTDQRFAGRFMARDYVTIREEQRGGQTVWTFATVAHDRLKSAPARVTRQGDSFRINGVAWGAPIGAVEVSIDGGPWVPARLVRHRHGGPNRDGYAWAFWTLDWGRPEPGEHNVTSRAVDEDGNVQPGPEDPFLAAKRTYWESNGVITRVVAIPA